MYNEKSDSLSIILSFIKLNLLDFGLKDTKDS